MAENSPQNPPVAKLQPSGGAPTATLAPSEVVLTASGVVPSHTHRDKDGKLTHAGMKHVLMQGGSVNYKGKILHTPDQLPSVVDLVKGDAAAEHATMVQLESAKADLQRQIDQLKTGK